MPSEFDGYNDLGWGNGWPTKPNSAQVQEPQELLDCRAKGHRPQSRNLDPTHHGYHTLYFCPECKILFHVDSSD